MELLIILSKMTDCSFSPQLIPFVFLLFTQFSKEEVYYVISLSVDNEQIISTILSSLLRSKYLLTNAIYFRQLVKCNTFCFYFFNRRFLRSECRSVIRMAEYFSYPSTTIDLRRVTSSFRWIYPVWHYGLFFVLFFIVVFHCILSRSTNIQRISAI